jgi:hypothetical protein
MRTTSMGACVHLGDEDRPQIDCVTQDTPSRPEGYPVLHVGPVAIFPEIGHLRRIRDAITGWLDGPDGARLAPPGPAPVQPDAIC